MISVMMKHWSIKMDDVLGYTVDWDEKMKTRVQISHDSCKQIRYSLNLQSTIFTWPSKHAVSQCNNVSA